MEKEIAILMADLTGYTAMTDVHGGASAAKVVHKYMQLVDQSLFGSTQVAQRIGDQVVMISDEPLDIIITARKLIGHTHEHHFLSVHMGIHYGSILIENGNFFGSTINIASRIMNLANRGQILCSSAYVDKLPTDGDFKFVPFGRHKLKNVLKEIEIFELSNSQSNLFYTDPVCHMLVDPGKENHHTTYQNQTFHFCSHHCLTIFNSSPEAFIES
jgi:class 3 adenylate cyclase/YHS domain-containing protein